MELPTDATVEALSLEPIPVNADAFIRMPEHAFDLRGKILTYTPQGDSYALSISDGTTLGDRGNELTANKIGHWYQWGTWGFKVTLPFAFKFGATSSTEVFANNLGSLSFGAAEYDVIGGRPTFAEGGIMSAAMAIELRSREGLEKLIAAYWADHHATKIYATVAADHALFTWEAGDTSFIKQDKVNGAHTDLKVNVFQARLDANGTITLAYPDVKTPDGVVGIFPGTIPASALLGETTTDIANGMHPDAQLKALRMYEEGSLLRFELELAAPVKDRGVGTHFYRIFFVHEDRTRWEDAALTVNVSANAPAASSTGVAPSYVAFRIAGSTVTFWASKHIMEGDTAVKVLADTIWYGGPDGAYSTIAKSTPLPLSTAQFQTPIADLSAPLQAARSGPYHEVFHQATMSRSPLPLLKEAYKTKRAHEDFAVLLTEFDLDSIHDVGNSTSGLNVAIKGLGDRIANPPSLAADGMPHLQGSLAICSLWAPLFDESVTDNDRAWKNYGPGVAFIAHEWGHRYGVQVGVRLPDRADPFYAAYELGHYKSEMNAPAVYQVQSMYTDDPYAEASEMGGNIWTENSDGSFTQRTRPYRAPNGFTAWDLYFWGLVPLSEVPDTFVVDGSHFLSDDRWSGTKVTIKAADVAAFQGEREPRFPDTQRRFKLRVYVLHRGTAPRPESIERARYLGEALRAYYRAASGGLMTMD